jgi:glycosyltransferase involved in cell wall biosynthesis
MTIGLDLSSLQSGHRMRGVGYTLINLLNNLPDEVKQRDRFVFFYHDSPDLPDPLEALRLNGTEYELRPLAKQRRLAFRLPGKLNVFVRFVNQFIGLWYIYSGDERFATEGIDTFLQTDQMIGLPRGRKIKKAFIAYDVIPYVLEWDYLWNYKTARAHDLPRQAAIRCAARRWMYIHKLRVNVRRADKVLAISEATRKDFLKHARAPLKKIATTPLGVNPSQNFDSSSFPAMHRYAETSWGYIKRPYRFNSVTPFVLFVGGGDQRRKLKDLVTAFNLIRARGFNLKLVLAGDTMQGPLNIPTGDIQNALKESSYIDDIIFMGFVSDRQRDWLYRNALAFVYPSRYEGFGLPVLEAFSYQCPVVAYRNAATLEIAGEAPLYANSAEQIRDHIISLINSDSLAKKSLTASKPHIDKYTWQNTVRDIFKAIYPFET